MKIKLINGKKVIDAVRLVAGDLSLTLADGEVYDVVVTVREVDSPTTQVTLEETKAMITYGGGTPRFLRGLAKLAFWLKNGEAHQQSHETPIFKTNGAMFDMSRNAVMKVETVKLLLRKMALMGLNTFMLYTEDTYEIEEYPYFGHMRGRYSKEEIRMLDQYAITLGIELIPCIQMLGHLATHLKWAGAAEYKDTANVLLVGSEQTTQLLRAMLRSISEAFTSKRIHVGMDETHDLGTGTYLDKNGYRDRQEIYFEHLETVIRLCREFGFEPMMWSDMFFRLAGRNIEKYRDYHPDVNFTDEVIQKIPTGIQQVFWDYYNADEVFYATNIEKHRKLFGENFLFAGGIWMWSGHCPLFSRSLRFTIPALDACRKDGVREVIATVWHNGAESLPILSLAGLAWYADYDYQGAYRAESVKECFEAACGVSYDAIIKCDCLERNEDSDQNMLSLSRAFLYNDPLLGLVDRHIQGYDTDEYYKKTTTKLSASKDAMGIFSSAYDVILCLSALLENKASFGVRLKEAYDSGDRKKFVNFIPECDEIIEKITQLKNVHRAAWMEINKPFGWEVHDIRYGGLIARFETTRERITSYLNGQTDRIEELEEERLCFDGKGNRDPEPRFNERFLWHRYQNLATPNIL